MRESDERYRALFDRSLDCVFLSDFEGNILDANQASFDLLGYAREDIPALNFMSMLSEDQIPLAIRTAEEIRANGRQNRPNEYRVQGKDGRHVDLEIRSSLIYRDGKPFAILGIARDLTGRKRAEAALRESQALYHSFIDQLPNPVFRKDAEGRYVMVNAPFCQLKGLGEADFLGKTTAEVGHSASVAEAENEQLTPFIGLAEETHELIMRTGNVVETEEEYPQTDGRKKIMHVMRMPVHAADGKVIGSQAILTDISERKLAEESQARLMMAVEHTPEAIMITDRAGVILYVNPAFEKRSGYTREEAIGQTPRLLKSGKHDAEFYRGIWAVLAAGQVWSGIITNRSKDGTLFEEDVSISPVRDDAGKVSNYVAVKRDVTEQRRMEAQMLRAQRLESIGTLAGGVAHDLNNMLAPILMAGELLRIEFPGTASTYLEMIQTSAQRGADMVRQLLTFARGAEGERVLLEPARLVKDLENMMKGSFPKNIQCAVKCDPGLPVLRGDVTQLHQVLLNLCVNARDAMPHGGDLTIEARRVVLDAAFANSVPDASPGEYVKFRVRDTGTGIPPDVLNRIFDPFFSTKDPDKGTGLGLSTVMGIVKGHQGFLQVYSEPGRGSAFSVFLPVDRSGKHESPDSKTSGEFRGRGETILFVDDEVAIRATAQVVLRRLNFNPLIATDGADGLIQAAQKRTELSAVITDMHMPHMDGLAFVQALRRMLPNIPILVASGRLDDDVALELNAMGVTSLLDKPFTEVELAAAMKSLLASK